MKLIAAVDRNWGIGQNGKLLTSIPADMKFFRETTKDHVVVMGRKTLESFPNQQPLPKRVNIVITKDPNYQVKGGVVVHSVEEAVEECKKYEEEDIFVIGGASIYKQMLSYCDKALITKIDYGFHADTYFPDLDKDPEWTMTKESDEETCFDLIYYFTQYDRIK